MPDAPSERWSVHFDASGYRREWLAAEVTVPLVCDGEGHGRSEDVWLCKGCAEALVRLLADVPPLLHDLELALTRQTEFTEHGSTGQGGDVEEGDTPLPFDPRASRALERLAIALDAPTARVGDVAATARRMLAWSPRMLTEPRVVPLLTALAEATVEAHAAIDRPAEPWYYGPCPRCKTDIYDERAVAVVTCTVCEYEAKADDHQRACLDAGDARMLTVSELVGAITRAGEAVTRDQINGWIRREGLAREKQARAYWRNGVLVSNTVYVYRLGDVRRLAQRADLRRAS